MLVGYKNNRMNAPLLVLSGGSPHKLAHTKLFARQRTLKEVGMLKKKSYIYKSVCSRILEALTFINYSNAYSSDIQID